MNFKLQKYFQNIKNIIRYLKVVMYGSKEKEWKWCGKCPKCLFVYTILSPYLYKEELIEIFEKDLFEDKNLLKTFIELTGHGETKPFECVGTFEEVNFAISLTISKLEKENKELPYLLKYYKEKFKLSDISIDITKRFNEKHNLTKKQEDILKREIQND